MSDTATPRLPNPQQGRVLSIQTGQVRPLRVGGRKLVSAIGKTLRTGPIEVGVLGLAGDEQADLTVHGGLRKAIYALPSEHLPWWQAQRQRHGATMFEEDLPQATWVKTSASKGCSKKTCSSETLCNWAMCCCA